MKIDKLERKKRFILMGFVLFSSFTLWCLNMLDTQSFNLSSLLNFILLLIGGSVAVHYMTEIYKTPINKENNKKWNDFGKYLFYSQATILFTVGVAYFEKYFLPLGGMLTILCILLAIFVLPTFAERAHLVFSKIKNS